MVYSLGFVNFNDKLQTANGEQKIFFLCETL